MVHMFGQGILFGSNAAVQAFPKETPLALSHVIGGAALGLAGTSPDQYVREGPAAGNSRQGKLVQQRIGWYERTFERPYEIVRTPINDNEVNITDEDGFVWSVKTGEGGTSSDYVSGDPIGESVPDLEMGASFMLRPGRPWRLSRDVERNMRRPFAMWLCTGNPRHLVFALEYGTTMLCRKKIKGISSEEKRRRFYEDINHLFRFTRIGNAKVRTKEHYLSAATQIFREIVPNVKPGTALTTASLIRSYFQNMQESTREGEGFVEFFRRVLKLSKVYAVYMQIFYGNAVGLYVSKLDVVVMHPDMYAWNEGMPAGHYYLASVIAHEMDHAALDNDGGGAVFNALRKVGKEGFLNILLNPFAEFAKLMEIYLNEGDARGAEWEVSSRIPPLARRAMLLEFSGIIGMEPRDIVKMNADEASSTLKERYSEEGLQDRGRALYLFHHLYDASNMTKDQYLRARRRDDGYDWRLPYLELRRRWRTVKTEGGKIGKIKFIVRHFVAVIAKLAALAYVLKKLLEKDEEGQKDKEK